VQRSDCDTRVRKIESVLEVHHPQDRCAADQTHPSRL